MKNQKIKTMEEFSDAIGLSRQTVSRFFNDEQNVRRSTRDLIKRGLEKFDYRPNFYASNLTRRKARAIGVIVPSIIDPFYSELVSSIEIYAEERGFLTVLQCSHNDPAMESRALARLLAINVQGIAMAPLGFNTNLDLVERARAETSLVFMDSQLQPNTPLIGTNNRQSIPLMVDYLCRTGEPPALFTMPAVNMNITERQQAYIDRMIELDHEPVVLESDATHVVDDYERFGFEQFMTIPREQISRSSTILCINDRVAIGVISAAGRLGLRVGNKPGDDLRVAGHDDQHFSRFISPSLTTVAQNPKAIGVLAARAILENGGENELMAKGKLVDGTMRFRDSA